MSDLFHAVEFEINHGCNKACSYCPNSIAERIETGFMQEDVYRTAINQLAEINFSGRISFSFYNEPMLFPGLEEYVATARTQLPGVTIDLYTNGTMLSLNKFRSLLEKGVSKFIVTKHEFVEKYEFDNTFAELSEEEKRRVVYRDYTEIKLTNRGGLLKHINPELKTALLPCHIPMQMMTITLKGNVVPCFEDFYQKNQMGNIMESSLLTIWKSPRYVEFRSQLKKGLRHKFEACNQCNRIQVL